MESLTDMYNNLVLSNTGSIQLLLGVLLALLCVYITWIYADTNNKEATGPNTQLEHGKPVPGPERKDLKTGNLDLIKREGSLLEFFVWLHKEYGHIVGFWMGEDYWISTASPESFKAQAHLFNRPLAPFLFIKPLIGGNSIQFTNDDEGKNRRKLQDRYYRQEPVDNFIPQFAKIAEQYVTPEWDDQIAKRPLITTMTSMAFKGISKFAFGDYFDDQKRVEEFKDLYVKAVDLMVAGMIEGEPKPGTQKHDELYSAIENMRSYAQLIISERGKDERREDQKVFIDGLLETYADEDLVIYDCITYLVAGFHTTAFTMVWCLYHLMQNPSLQDEVYADIVKAMQNSDGKFDKSTVKNIGLLAHCVDETMRLCGPGPFAARYFEQDTLVCGYNIPAKVPVIQNLFSIFLNEKYFPDPLRFDPHRFSAERKSSIPKLAFAPFGFAGGRQCPGYKVAVSEAITYLAILLSKYKFVICPGQKVEMDYAYVIVKPKEEVWFTLHKRTPAEG